MDKNKNKLFYALSSEGLNSVFSQIGGVYVCVGGLLWLCPGPHIFFICPCQCVCRLKEQKGLLLIKTMNDGLNVRIMSPVQLLQSELSPKCPPVLRM